VVAELLPVAACASEQLLVPTAAQSVGVGVRAGFDLPAVRADPSDAHRPAYRLGESTFVQARTAGLDGDSIRGVNEAVVPVLYVEDATRAVAWYARLGFQKEWEHQFDPGFPWFVSVARGEVRLYLSEHKGDARPNTLIHLYVNNIDDVSREFGVPVDEEGLAGRECAFEDLDGNRLRVATPRS
jgi:catechol 2,3-dioxygenase-like lactoylglutathione lyase family enzyme